ncbi:holo-ACP synthase [Gulosibacter faecalis]|jgi:holo-[acyl-carrier protein] synthase|uniref:Holo-[acyl-carrier-protein] synthase n=1 Tax=Gulosibacter faecalis TaxID=272240 RepID=A0ABW5UTY9_9MICO|nr:holo-ACP synthase [Gulosibacter faecalis]
MIIGIGVDTVEHTRVERALRVPGFGPRIFTEAELALPLTSICARWAAREAAVKALGGLHGIALRDLEVHREHLGAPSFVLGEALEGVLARLGVARLHLSLSHDRDVATAFVIAEGAS